MKSFRVIFTERSSEDLLEIYVTIGARDERAAEKTLRRIEQRVAGLNSLAQRGMSRPELGDGIRILLEEPYLIVYRVSDREVEILRVVHGAMDLAELFN